METPFQEWIQRLGRDLGAHFRSELSVFRREATEQGRAAGIALVWISATGVAAIVALGTFTTFLVLVLAQAIEPWLAALMVAAAYALVCTALGLEAKRRFDKAFPLKFDRTAAAVKEDVSWVASGMKPPR